MIDEAANVPTGSTQGAIRIFLYLVIGSVLTGFFWSVLSPGLRVVGTWIQEDSSADILRFDADGTYWHHRLGGILTMHLLGTYEVLGSSADTYRIRAQTQKGEMEFRVRLDSSDRLFLADSSEPGAAASYRRTDDWILAIRASATASTYDGAKPHLGCWQRKSRQSPDLEFLQNGTFVQHSDDEIIRSTFTVEYSKIPFQLDISNTDSQTERTIFEFIADGSLRLTRQRPGAERPKKILTYQDYVRCPQTQTQGVQDAR